MMKKKFISRLWLLMMVAAMCFCVAACGKTEKDTKKDDDRKTVLSNKDDKDDEDDKDKVDDEDDKKGSSTSNKPTIQEYVNDPNFQSQYESMKQSFANSGMDIDIKAEGDSLVYVFQYADVEKSDELAAALESELAKQDFTFQSTADSIQLSVSNENVKVIIRYLDKNGDEIYSKEYVAK